MTPTKELREQIGEIHAGEIGPTLSAPAPPRRRPKVLSRPVIAQLIVSRAFRGIPQNVVGLVHVLEFLLGARLLGNIRVVLAGESPVGLLDVLRRGAAGHAQ